MRTTVAIDDELLELAKQRAHDLRLTLGQFVERGLRAELLQPRSQVERIPLPVFGEGGVRPGIDPTSNASLFAAADSAGDEIANGG